MGNRLDNMTESERENRFETGRVGLYLINRAGSLDLCKAVLSRLPHNNDTIIQLLASIEDEQDTLNRVSVINAITEKIEKMSNKKTPDVVNKLALLRNKKRYIERQIYLKQKELQKVENQIKMYT